MTKRFQVNQKKYLFGFCTINFNFVGFCTIKIFVVLTKNFVELTKFLLF